MVASSVWLDLELHCKCNEKEMNYFQILSVLVVCIFIFFMVLQYLYRCQVDRDESKQSAAEEEAVQNLSHEDMMGAEDSESDISEFSEDEQE